MYVSKNNCYTCIPYKTLNNLSNFKMLRMLEIINLPCEVSRVIMKLILTIYYQLF